jgi:hypothetical protein
MIMILRKTLLATALLSLTLGMTACKKDAPVDAAAPADGAAADAPADAGATPDGSAPVDAAAAAPVAAASGDLGIAECDSYITKLKACINDKVPEAQRAMFNQQYDAAIEQWRTQATDATQKAALAQACKQAEDQAKASFTAMGCTF